MQTRNPWRAARWLACLTIVCALFPTVSHAGSERQTVAATQPTAVLGVTPSKTLSVVPLSVRNADYPATQARDATGDTYDAAGLIQDGEFAYFLDDFPDNHTFGTGEETAGARLLAPTVDMRIIGVDLGPGVPGTNQIQVRYSTMDGSPLVPAGAMSDGELIFTSWRMDVGTVEAGTDKIDWTPNPGFTVITSGFCVLNDGVVVGCVPLLTDDSDANGVAGVGAAAAPGGGDIADFPVDEMAMFWDIQLNPSCGDGNLDDGEECDDGNIEDGDGCSSTCTNEAPLVGDHDGDGRVDLDDIAALPDCMTGPGAVYTLPACAPFDANGNTSIDLFDFSFVQRTFTGPTCGDGNLDSGEQCDPPDGITCDAACQLLVPLNDSCNDAIDINEQIVGFSTIGATTDGTSDPVCDFSTSEQVESDIWFCYTATCTDTIVVGLCGSGYDTTLAVYEGCTCPVGPIIDCDDDSCGDTFQTRLTFLALTGQDYLIRIGGYFDADQGLGVLSVYCTNDGVHGTGGCGTGAGDCFADNGTPACEDVDTCEAVCEADPYCCDVAWDQLCADRADGITGNWPVCNTATGDCDTANAGVPGCNNVDCCQLVCDLDDYCCTDEWDIVCVDHAVNVCGP